MLHDIAQHPVPGTRTFAAERELKDAGVWKPGEGLIITITGSETIIYNPIVQGKLNLRGKDVDIAATGKMILIEVAAFRPVSNAVLMTCYAKPEEV